MLEMTVNVDLIKEKEKDYFIIDKQGNIIEGEGFGSGKMQRIPHPEMTASGTCPVCYSDAYRIFDPQTMEGEDGHGKLNEIPVHPHCVCEDVPLEMGRAMGYLSKEKFQELRERIKSGNLKGFNKTQQELLKQGVIDVADIFAEKREAGMKSNEKIKEALQYKKKGELLDLAIKMGYSVESLSGLKNKELIDKIINTKGKKKELMIYLKERIPILKIGWEAE